MSRLCVDSLGSLHPPFISALPLSLYGTDDRDLHLHLHAHNKLTSQPGESGDFKPDVPVAREDSFVSV